MNTAPTDAYFDLTQFSPSAEEFVYEATMKRLKTDDRDQKYDLAASFEYILNEENPRNSRAIRLYELQTAILTGKKLRACQLREDERRDNWILVSRAALSAARSVSKLRLLEHVIRESYSDTSEALLLKKLVRDREAKRLIKQIGIGRTLREVAYSLSWKEFDRLLRDTREKQKSYAPLYHVSMHFALHGAPGSKCNWSCAEALLRYNRDEAAYHTIRKYFKDLPSPSTVYKYKPKGNRSAAFIWLDHFGGEYLRPTKPTSVKFAEKLLAKIDDPAGLRNYIGQYFYVRSRLEQQGYDVPELSLSTSILPRAVSFEPLPSELISLI